MNLVDFCPEILWREENPTETRRKTLCAGGEYQQLELNTHMVGGWNRIRATFVAGACSHYCDFPAPHLRF